MLKNTIVLVLGLFLVVNGYSKILIVNNLADSGPGSLRWQIVSALPNDTFLINTKGTLVLTVSPILMYKALTIQESAASPFTIDVNDQYLDLNMTGLSIGDILTATSTKIVSTNDESSEFLDTIMVRAPYLVSIIDSTDVLCNGNANGRLEVSVTGGNYAPYIYQWYLVGSGPIAGANSNVYFTGPGTYTCEVTDTVSAVVFSDTATIAEPPLLTVTSNVNNTLCNLSCDGSIVLSETGGTPPYQYSIDNGSFYQSSTTFLSLCANTYQIVVKDANSCLTTSNNVIVNPPPAISISSIFTPETCSGLNDGTISVSPNGGTGPYNFRIDAGVYGPGTFFGGLSPGNHIVDILDINGCTTNIGVSILAGNLVTANFSVSSTNSCQNNFGFNFTDLSTNSSSLSTAWNWTFPSASPSSATISNVSGVAFFNSGVNNVTLTVTAADGCIGTVVIPVTVSPEPVMSVSSPVNACSGWAPFDMNTNFIPSISGGVWSGVGVTGVNFNSISTGVGTFDVIYTTSVGCDDTVTINVQAAPSPTITGLNATYCITDAAFIPTGSPAGGFWSIDGAPFTTITTIDPSTFSAGTHSLSYQFTDLVTGCAGTTTPNLFVISLVPLDPIAVSNTNQSICGSGSLVLTVSNPNTAGTTIQWYSDAALTINVGSTINFTTPVLTSSIIYYAVAQNTGCKSNPVILNITVNNPQVSAGPDLTICPLTPALLNLTSATGTISWSPGILLSDSTIQNPIATPNVNTTYVVTVTSGPCSSSDSVNVIIDGSNPDCGIVPSYNAFSPDNDGVNDTWIIDAIIAHPDNIVTIYNRWGDKLVSFDDYDNVNVVWDGKYKGEILPSGTYFYVVEYLDIQMQVSGWLQLTR